MQRKTINGVETICNRKTTYAVLACFRCSPGACKWNAESEEYEDEEDTKDQESDNARTPANR